MMADREMVAATLAAGLLIGKNLGGTRVSPEEYAVALYQRVLRALDTASNAQPLPRMPIPG